MTLRLENIERLHLLLLLAVAATAYATRWVSAGSVVLGGAVMGANFWLMRKGFRFVIGSPDQPRRAGLAAALLLLKFTLFLGLLGLLFWRVPLDAMGFGVGATVLLVACVTEALRCDMQPNGSH